MAVAIGVGQSSIPSPAAVIGDVGELGGPGLHQPRTQSDRENRTAVLEFDHGELELLGLLGQEVGTYVLDRNVIELALDRLAAGLGQ